MISSNSRDYSAYADRGAAPFGKRDDTVHTGDMEPESPGGRANLAAPRPATPARRWAVTHVDPVCGMTIERDAVGSYECHGVTYYFCAESCLERFRASDAF
jgi:YHS domain-containing protein